MNSFDWKQFQKEVVCSELCGLSKEIFTLFLGMLCYYILSALTCKNWHFIDLDERIYEVNVV